MAKKSLTSIIGSWAFLVGVILAVAFGLIQGFALMTLNDTAVSVSLFVIGIIIGLVNIKAKEVQPFLISGIVLIIASVFGVGAVSVVPSASNILIALLEIFTPATIIVAIKNVFILAKD